VLLLDRDVGESFVMETTDGTIVVKIVNCERKRGGGRRYRIGISAPDSVIITRAELLDRPDLRAEGADVAPNPHEGYTGGDEEQA
jgi:sRNA-binding carbon storage regulator CsrA